MEFPIGCLWSLLRWVLWPFLQITAALLGGKQRPSGTGQMLGYDEARDIVLALLGVTALILLVIAPVAVVKVLQEGIMLTVPLTVPAKTVTPADLMGANLKGWRNEAADLQGANLRIADLRGAYLRNAKLQGADLVGANLNSAVLDGVRLEGADLSKAHLVETSLESAFLRGAKLDGADLRRAVLRDADLRSANLLDANLAGADLSRVRYSDSTTWPQDFVIPADALRVED